jgi:phenylacetate-CoA ligase
MKFDLSSLPLGPTGFSRQPMTIIDGDVKALLAMIMEIAMLETGNRKAREEWQRIQLENLLQHAMRASAFWRARLGGKKPAEIKLASLPILTRADLHRQVASEGSLLPSVQGIRIKPHSTSGSSGTPVKFFVSEINAQYNDMRYVAQFFIEGWDVSLNRTRLFYGNKPGISITEHPAWLGPLAPLIACGKNRHIEYLNPDLEQLMRELTREPIGILTSAPRILDSLSASFDLQPLKQAEARLFIANGEAVSDELVRLLGQMGIPVRSNYSSEEVGPIAFECGSWPGHYHVATSNVIVETADWPHDVDGMRLGKVLVTHLHSYATPVIRYDLGDLACLQETCPCGHDGPTVHALHGRLGACIKHRDGRMTAFYVPARALLPLAQFTEYRIRQTEFEKIVLELGGRSELTPVETEALSHLLRSRAGQEFAIEVKACPQIDWGESRKRLGFRSEVSFNR